MKIFNPVDYLGNDLRIEETEIDLSALQKAFLINYLFTVGRRNELGGSFQLDRNLAHRVAFAEAFERKIFLSLTPKQKIDLDVTNYPTTCGFAAGFESDKTKLRALSEALERWAWEKIVDQGIPVRELAITQDDYLSYYLLNSFDEAKAYTIDLEFAFDQRHINAKLLIVLGFKGKGVFPGSRVEIGKNISFQHGILEAWRHLQIAKGKDIDKSNLIDQRIVYFSEHKDDVQKLFKHATGNSDFQHKLILRPKIKFLKSVFSDDKVFVYRALCEDFWGWDKGDEKRFVF